MLWLKKKKYRMYPESHSLIAPKNKRISYGIHSDNGGVDGPHTLWLLWSLITHPLQGTVVGLKANSAQYNGLIKQTRARLNGVCFLTTKKKNIFDREMIWNRSQMTSSQSTLKRVQNVHSLHLHWKACHSFYSEHRGETVLLAWQT